MTQFPSHQTCTLCPLHETASHPGLPTRPFKPIEKPSQFALLIVGEAPGFHEDQQNQSWVGATGQLLSAFINHTDFGPYDIYLSNSCRCLPPRDITPSNKQVGLCRPHLLNDIQALLAEYSKLVIFCLGATAAKSVSGLSKLKDCFRLQGVSGTSSKFLSDLPESDKILLFFSYHPAILLPGRKPALVTAVESHFKLLSRYCTTSRSPFSVTVNPHIYQAPPPLPAYSRVTVDIETYGILAGRQQSCFHPIKSLHIDQTRIAQQVVSVSFSIITQPLNTSEDRTGVPFELPQTQSYYYDWSNPAHRRYIHQWFRNISQSHSILIGQNILFDLTYMLISDSIIASLVTPSTIQLDDTLILSFFLYDQRPEHGLKELSLLFGLADYSSLSVTGSSGTATGPDDPALQFYNMLDSTVTLTLYCYLNYLIAQKYGPSSPKLSPLSVSFRSEVLWSIILLQLNGFSINCTTLESLLAQYQASISACLKEGEKAGLIFAGKGSQKSMRDFFTLLVEQNGLTDEPSIERTPKTKALSLGANNTQTLMRIIPPYIVDGLDEQPNSDYQLLSLYSQYVTDSKIENTYLTPLLTEPKRGIVYRRPHSNTGQCFPVWYPTPRESSNTSGGDGGTVQARFSCKAPAAQTFPPVVKTALCSRWPAGKLLWYDLSQMELRVAALLSGDPMMMNYYTYNRDIHTETALLIDPLADPTSEAFLSPNGLRALGKTVNFLMLYRGGSNKLRETANKQLGLSLTYDFCQSAVSQFYYRHHVLGQWQEQLIATARKQGYLELLTGWGRTFGLGKSADSYINEICNFPVQTIAAQLLQSSQFAVTREISERNLRSCICLQVHDSLCVDTWPTEEPQIDRLMEKHLTHPPLLAILENQLGRTVPITYKKEKTK